jgi:N-acetylmuramoyl-L-alanine amidase
VRFETSGTQVRFTFDTVPRTAGAVTQEPNRLLVHFEADALDTAFPPLVPQGLVDAIRLGDAPGTVALVLGPRFGSYKVSSPATDTSSARLVVELQPAAEQPSPPAPPVPAPTPPPVSKEAPSIAAAQTVRTVVIDPGHGGTDEGAKGAAGTLEKDLTLSVARKLKSAIENRLGLRALLTRDADALVTLDERAAFANNNKADLFISVHANASLAKAVKGAQVYYLSLEGYEAQQSSWTAATFPTFGGASREIDVILWEVAQRQHLAESAAFAAVIEDELQNLVPMNGQPVQQAPFRVLVGANMPAVLVEIGFLTNPDQEQTMASAEFQNAVVQALLNAVVRFRDTVERGRVATTAPAVRAPDRP